MRTKYPALLDAARRIHRMSQPVAPRPRLTMEALEVECGVCHGDVGLIARVDDAGKIQSVELDWADCRGREHEPAADDLARYEEIIADRRAAGVA